MGLDQMPPRRVVWIGKAEWNALLRRSRSLSDEIRHCENNGHPVDRQWQELRPINETIRSPLLKVRGIDDRTPHDS